MLCTGRTSAHRFTYDRQPWLAHYGPGVPHTIDVPPIALPELLAAARDFPDAPAIFFYGRTIAYAELDRLVSRFAAALLHTGVAPGERIVLVLPAENLSSFRDPPHWNRGGAKPVDS